MNKVIICGRLTRDPETRYSQQQDGNNMAIARYTVAVDRRLSSEQRKSENVQTADFISVVAFGRAGEFAEKYLKKGTKVIVTGRIQTGSYTNKDGVKVYTTDVVAEDQEFAESKNAASSNGNASAQAGNTNTQADPAPAANGDGFMNIPDGIEEELPFN